MNASNYVHEIPLGNVKAFIIEGEKTVLIDTGISPVPAEVLTFFEQNGIKLGDDEQRKFLKKGSFQFIMSVRAMRRAASAFEMGSAWSASRRWPCV